MSDRDELVKTLNGILITAIRANYAVLGSTPIIRANEAVQRARDQIDRDGREIEDLRRRLGGGCDANAGGDHTVITQGRYRFCGKCGESLTGVRYCHAPRAALNEEGET